MAAKATCDVIKNKIPGIRDSKVYNDANSKDIENYVLYMATDVNADVTYVYKDQACTEKATYDEVVAMFLKGLVLCGELQGCIFFQTVQDLVIFDLENNDGHYAYIYCDYGRVYSAEYVEQEN